MALVTFFLVLERQGKILEGGGNHPLGKTRVKFTPPPTHTPPLFIKHCDIHYIITICSHMCHVTATGTLIRLLLVSDLQTLEANR